MLQRFADTLAGILRAHGIADHLIDHEIGQIAEQCLAKTNNRSVVGIMTDFVRLADWRRHEITDPSDLARLSLELAQTPCSPLYGRHISPDRELTATLAG